MEDKYERLGKLIDRLDGLSYGLSIPIPDGQHVEQLKRILPEITKDMKKSFVEITNENPWE